jgi:hypothetical protein
MVTATIILVSTFIAAILGDYHGYLRAKAEFYEAEAKSRGYIKPYRDIVPPASRLPPPPPPKPGSNTASHN